jgi:putative addiction module component (TIGR02574 family)
MAAADMLADILRLPAEDRAKLALELLRSLDGAPESGAAEAWDAEIDRRAAEIDSGKAETLTLDEYRAHEVPHGRVDRSGHGFRGIPLRRPGVGSHGRRWTR